MREITYGDGAIGHVGDPLVRTYDELNGYGPSGLKRKAADKVYHLSKFMSRDKIRAIHLDTKCRP